MLKHCHRLDQPARRLFLTHSGLLALGASASGLLGPASSLASAAAAPESGRLVSGGSTARGELATAEAVRLVSVGGALTQIVLAIGAGDQLVGVDTTSRLPDGIALPNVGYARALSAEGLLSLRPTRVLATAEAGPAHALQRLEQAGVALHRFGQDLTPQGLQDRILRVGQVCEQPEAAAALAQRVDAEFRALLAQRPLERAPRVVFLLGHTPQQIMVSGRDTVAHAMLQFAGAINPLAESFAGYRPLTPEAIVMARPDILLITRQGLEAQGGEQAITSHSALARSPAARAGRIVALDALDLLGFGPETPAMLRQLRNAFIAVG